MSDTGSDIGAFMAGFVIGGLVGAATALILAPQSGEETRAQIAQRSQEMKRSGEVHLHDYREAASSAVADARSRVQDTTGQVQERARIVLDEGRSKAGMATDKSNERMTPTQHDAAQDEQEDAEEGEPPTS